MALPSPPYRHPDLSGLEGWLFDGLASLARRFRIGTIVACSHGSGGVLVDDAGPVMPMIDYEQKVPPGIDARYRELIGPFRERGSPILLGAAHLARQMLWLESEWPEAFYRARWFLGLPQYWAWRLTGTAASEVTMLGAQSHLWNVRDRRFCDIVPARGWERLLPPLRPAWHPLGRLDPKLARRLGFGDDTLVLCGIHDSTANFYRYQAAGLAELTVISTGTWIVGLSDALHPDALAEERRMTCNADVHGRPLAGVLAMGGREFAAIAGDAAGPADARAVGRLLAAGTMALPCFADDDGPFAGRAGRGRIIGAPPRSAAERRALAVLYTALLTDLCLDLLRSDKFAVLDGTYLNEPLYAPLVQALRPGRKTLFNRETYGTAMGAAMLATHATRVQPAPVDLQIPAPLHLPDLTAYRERWRTLAEVSP